MTCQDLADFLMDYIEGALPQTQRDEFDSHLGACPPCIEYMKSYEETIRMGKTLCDQPDAPIPDDVPEKLIRAILSARAKSAS